MSGQHTAGSSAGGSERSMVCQIRLKGHLADRWRTWFGGLTIIQEEDGTTLLTGPVVDQAALHGILKKIRDLGMPLLSVNFVDAGPQDIT